MIVRLSHARYRRVTGCASPEVLDSMEVEELTGKNPLAVTAPYVAWELAKQSLVDTYLSPSGGMKKDPQTTALITIKVIATALNEVMRHPAFRSKGMAGLHQEWFPAWERLMTSVDGHHYTPMPNGGRFVVLGPVWEQSDRVGHSYTFWTEEGAYPIGHRLAAEATHRRCLGEDC